LSYTLKSIGNLEKGNPAKLAALYSKTGFNYQEETKRWHEIINGMHFPADPVRNVILQQDGFLDKELMPANSLPAEQRPINQHWSWDRILRSCFIKQADVLQGLYVFEDQFDTDTIKRNFDFYEPMTVHESSLSACIHSIMASRIGNIEKAYELYLRTARLDLDDYNNEVSDGLHITSMAGTWLAVVEGFGGMRVHEGKLLLRPLIPANWNSYSFHARFRGMLFQVKVTRENASVVNLSHDQLAVVISGKEYSIESTSLLTIDL
jgi:maltose phosphorylase